MDKHEKERIDQLIRHTMRIARGDYEDSLVLSDRVDELDALTIAVKMMTDDIKASIAEIKNLQEKLYRLKKMEALGLLAGGVAHDLNNILTGVLSYPELLLMDASLSERTRKGLETIRGAAERAAAVVKDLMSVARGAASEKIPVVLNDMIDDFLLTPEFICIQEAAPNVLIQTELEPGLKHINASKISLFKLMMNLVMNAVEAVDKNGRIGIFTKNLRLYTPRSGYEQIEKGEYVVLTVSDNGSGIPPDHLERIFEPFYSTKIMGKSGTGLGLTIVWNIIHDHQGYININSDEQGTRFECFFPVTEETEKEEKGIHPVDACNGLGQRILVVDDDPLQRELLCEILKTLGYNPSAVQSGEEALAYVQSQSFDLILLDMLLSNGMNGRETYALILKKVPGQRAVIISGYAETGDMAAAMGMGAGSFIQKPYTIDKIRQAVKKELSS
jgi:two-component system, cell cycle sensor histidine kinase and response regulator CckA